MDIKNANNFEKQYEFYTRALFEEIQSKAENMNNRISWDDIFNKKFIKTESND